MKKLFISIIAIILFLTTVSFAHKGRTDSEGGHYDSSTGLYHYHHGYPAHQHTDGKCPYNYDNQTSSSSGSFTINIDNDTLESNHKIEQLQEENKNLISGIYDLNKEIDNYKKKLKEKESDISDLWIGFIFIFVIGIYISYNIGLYNKKSK